MARKDKRRLGRGIETLLTGSLSGAPEAELLSEVADLDAAEFQWIPVAQIEPNPYQPRASINPTELQSLVDSIKQHGILQPVIVKPIEGGYQLIAGERRLRAAELAGLQTVPARVIPDVSDQQIFELAIVENLQRSDLNPIEKARAFKEYLDRFGGTLSDLARRIGLDATTVSNFIRLLDLPPEIQKDVELGKLSMGQARALLGLKDPEQQLDVAKRVVVERWSVRKVEKYVSSVRRNSEDRPTAGRAASRTPHIDRIEDLLCQKLGTAVQVQVQRKHRGKIVIPYASEEEFERIVETILGRPYEELVR